MKIPGYVYLKQTPQKAIDAEILCISEGGAFVRCAAPIALGQEILVEIRFAEIQSIEGKVIESDRFLKDLTVSEMTNRSVIRWARGTSNTGFGVEFVGVNKGEREFLKKLMEYFQQLSKAGVDFTR